MRLSPGRIKSSHGPGISVWLQVAYPCASVLNCVRNQTKAKSLFVHCSFSTSFTFFFHHFPLALVGSRLVSACAVCLIGSIFRVRNALVEGFVSTSAETCLILACISCHWHFLIFSTFFGCSFWCPTRYVIGRHEGHPHTNSCVLRAHFPHYKPREPLDIDVYSNFCSSYKYIYICLASLKATEMYIVSLQCCPWSTPSFPHTQTAAHGLASFFIHFCLPGKSCRGEG